MKAKTNRTKRTPAQIESEGFAALVDKLGIADALRFVMLHDPGHGNYTRDRHKWLDRLTFEEVTQLMRGARKHPAKRRRA